MTRSIATDAAVFGVLLGACVHAVLGLAAVLGPAPGPVIGPVTVIVMPMLVAAMAALDQRISHEAVFLANLGIRRWVAPLAAGAAMMVVELAMLLLL
jgi:hypothetical protein